MQQFLNLTIAAGDYYCQNVRKFYLTNNNQNLFPRDSLLFPAETICRSDESRVCPLSENGALQCSSALRLRYHNGE